MRGPLLTTTLLLTLVRVDAAPAQTRSRLAVGPVARVERVSIDGHTTGTTAVTGIAASVRVSRAIAIEGELTGGAADVSRSYEGQFISYAPGPTVGADDFARFAPVARRTLSFTPRVGGAGMVVARHAIAPRITLAGRLGAAARRYTERSRYVVLSVPPGVDPARVARDFAPESRDTIRGGLLGGVDVELALTDRIAIAPQLRFVHSGPAGFGNRHRELGAGVSGRWQF